MSFFQVGWSPIMKNKSQVFALKYRPQTFDDLIGHEEIASAIYNSIKYNKIANAFLFTGIRGIGKTTFARIVAKSLNCENGIENLCTTKFCSNCQSIINSNHIDVLEIDAASKTGVDDVRELIEFSRYAPSVAKFKIFIIDEVHMLSKQAFNALLKTLEEPPSYLKFVFATTEIRKIPITVISRCQRFNLSRIKSDQLYQYLKKIGLKENKEIEDNALKLIVKISEGSARDALSLLDRALISIKDNKLSFESAQKIFGYIDKSAYLELLELIFKGDEGQVINQYRNIYNSGLDHFNFLNEFLEILYYIKNVTYIRTDSKNFLLNDADYKKISELSKKLSPSDILLFWEFTLKIIKEINLVSNPNLSIEMFLLQLIYLKNKIISKTYEIDKSQNLINNTQVTVKQENETVSQIKNLKQEEEVEEKKKSKKINNLETLQDLIDICSKKKEIKLKYELENNVNLVSFLNNRIEISFNDRLNKSFVKELSEKLLEWTDNRWIITFSSKKGDLSNKEKKKRQMEGNIKEFKSSKDYSDLLKSISDIELTEIETND